MRRALIKGYTLVSPLTSTAVYLVDMQGRVVHTWRPASCPALTASLLENGQLLRSGAQPNSPFGNEFVAGGGGRIQKYEWNGDLACGFYRADVTANMVPHDDFVGLPNGNVLLVIKERKTPAEAIAAFIREQSNPERL